MDRVSRAEPFDALTTFQRIISAGITIVTLQDGKVWSREAIKENPFKLLESLLAMIRANEESEVKSKRVRAAWDRKKQSARENKTPMTARVPAWLKLSRDGATFEVYEDRAAVIRRIFRDTLAGKGQHAIAQELNEEGVQPFGNGKSQAKYWHRTYVAKILRNPAVAGTFVPHQTRVAGAKRHRDPLPPIPDYFPRIIEQRTFDTVQKRLAMRNTPRIRAAKGEVSNVLASLAKCPLCGSTMTRVSKGFRGGLPYLVCTRAKSGGGCDYRAIKLTHVEAAIAHAASRQLIHDVPLGDPDIDRQLRSANDLWSEITLMIDRFTSEIAEGNPSAALRRRLAVAEQELQSLERSISQLEAKVDRGSRRSVQRVVKNLDAVLNDPKTSVTQRNLALRDAFSHVVVEFRTGDLLFFWHHGGEPTKVPYSVPDAASGLLQPPPIPGPYGKAEGGQTPERRA